MTEHFHTFAVQDWGGNQERWVSEDTQFTREDAEVWATAMADADSAYVSGDINRYEAARTKYGDGWSDLISGNVCPGWNAIWILPCTEPCGFETALDKAAADRGRSLGEPWWKPTSDTAA